MDISRLLQAKSLPEALQILVELFQNTQFSKAGSVQIEADTGNYFFSLDKGLQLLDTLSNPDLKIVAKESVILDLLKGKLAPPLALVLGKVKLFGDKSLMVQIKELLK